MNIATVKYWGKRDKRLILPSNSSISITLHQRDLRTHTLVVACNLFTEDLMWLNGKEESLEESERLKNCLAELRARASPDLAALKLHVWTVNNFPTAAGLASSASGLSCFVFTISELFGIKEKFEGEFSTIARQGSGSACRSLYGGFVRWDMGERPDGLDSKAVQIAPQTHWPELCALICVASDARKILSSTGGMQTSLQTSTLIQHRLRLVPDVVKRMEQAIMEKDFESFGKLTMMESNQLHAICLDTYPPIFYLNDTSRLLIQFISHWNTYSGKIMAAYTFDAGPNAIIFVLKENLSELVRLLFHYLPPPPHGSESLGDAKYFNNGTVLIESHVGQLPAPDIGFDLKPQPAALKYIVYTEPGPGPILRKLRK